MLCASRVSPAGIGSYRGPVTVRCLKRDRIRVDAGVVHTSPGRRGCGAAALGCGLLAAPVVTRRCFHDREDFATPGSSEPFAIMKSGPAPVPGRERRVAVDQGKLCMRSTAACDGREMLKTHVILTCLRGGVMAHKARGRRDAARSPRACRAGWAGARAARQRACASRGGGSCPKGRGFSPIPGVIGSIPDDYVQLMTIGRLGPTGDFSRPTLVR